MDPNLATKPAPNNTALYYEALAAYVKANKVCSEWPAMPTRTGSSISGKFVTLRSKNFLLGRYDIEKKQFSKKAR